MPKLRIKNFQNTLVSTDRSAIKSYEEKIKSVDHRGAGISYIFGSNKITVFLIIFFSQK